MTRLQYPALSLAAPLTAGLACATGGGGGVTGHVRDESGRPIVTATVTLVSSPTPLGVPNPLAEAVMLAMTTDEEGMFGVFWSHGSGHILKVSPTGHLVAQVTLSSGYSTCDFVLVPEGATKSSSNGHCRKGRAAEQ